MKLIILGANGRTGRHLVEGALARDHDVTAIIRRPDALDAIAHPRFRCLIGDPCKAEYLAAVMPGKDAVLSALGGRRPTRSASAVYWRSAQAIVQAAEGSGPKRVLVTSTALLFPEQALWGKVLRGLVRPVVQAAMRMEQVLQTSDLAWTVAMPGFLTDGPGHGYVSRKDGIPARGASVSRSALAQFLLDALEKPETCHGRFGLANGAGCHPGTPPGAACENTTMRAGETVGRPYLFAGRGLGGPLRRTLAVGG